MVPRPLGTKTPGRPGAQTPGPQDSQTPRPLGTQASRPPDATTYDIAAKAEERQTLRLTDAEFRRLGMLQSQLEERLGVKKVDKNDIMRSAIHAALEEYERTGAESELVRRLRKKYR